MTHAGEHFPKEKAPDFDKVREELTRALKNGAVRFIPGRDEMQALVAVFDHIYTLTAERDALKRERDEAREALRYIAKQWPDSFAARHARSTLSRLEKQEGEK